MFRYLNYCSPLSFLPGKKILQFIQLFSLVTAIREWLRVTGKAYSSCFAHSSSTWLARSLAN